MDNSSFSTMVDSFNAGKITGTLFKAAAYGCTVTALLVLLGVLKLNHVPTNLKAVRENGDILSEADILFRSSLPTELPNSSCRTKLKHFVLTKIEKTGSSTLFGILSRFSQNNKLNLLSQKKGYHITWTGPNDGKDDIWMIGPQAVERADVLINHAKYNKSIFDKYMKKDYKLIVPFRDPVSWMKSAAKYFSSIAHIDKQTPNEILADDELLFKERVPSHAGMETWFHLPQLQWLGFDYSQKGNLTIIETFIAEIVSKIDILFLNEEFDASLLIMKKRFCWDYTDIFYASYEVNKSHTSEISKASIHELLSPRVNRGEQLLYESVYNLWWNQPEVEHKSFWQEVTYFTRLNKQVSTSVCSEVLENNKSHEIAASLYHGELMVTPRMCKQIRISKVALLGYIKKYVEGGDSQSLS